MGLRPYQELAADFLYSRDRAMILAPVGAGKTAITLAAMRGKFLVVAPKRVAVSVWPTEAKKWAPELSVAVCVGTPAQRVKALMEDADITVTNYDNLQWLANNMRPFDGIVFDELTRLKNPSGARFKALLKVIDPIQIRWGLTGSFTSNGLEDVFGQCKIIDQKLLGRSKGAFQQQYFTLINKEYGEWEPRKGSLEAVMERIKPATFVLDPGEYADKLPPLHTVDIEAEMDLADYKEMKQEMVLRYGDERAIAANAAVVTAKLQQLASGFVYAENGATISTSTHKFDALDNLLQENQHANTIVVYNFKAELEELQRRYPKARTIEGSIDDWNDGKIELLLVHPKSAGHGLNLQHGGSKIVFFSLPWSLELYEQTIGRLHRSGQRHDVWCYRMITKDTVDEKIARALADKQSVSSIAMEALK
jgi:SNF2 family DNA or RNA helicase